MREEIKERIKKIDQGDAPKGYCFSNMTIIPKDWKLKKIKEIAHLNSRSLNSNTSASFNFYYIDISSVNQGRIKDPLDKIQFKNAPSRARRIVKKGDIIVSNVRPNLKGHALIDFEKEADIICSTGFTVLTPHKDEDRHLVYQFLFSYFAEKQFFVALVGSNYPAISNFDVGNLKIFYPDKKNERKKIGKILKTWDSFISLKEKLIELKKEQKKGLMNYLLTGKSRFPGFIDKWEETEIGKLAEVVSGVTPPTSNKKYWGGKIPWCTPTDITKSSKYIKKTEKTITKEALKENRIKLLPENSILMCSRATIGPRSINKVPMTTNQGFKSFICFEEKIDNEFLYYLIGILEKKFVSLSNGSTFLELSKKDLLKTQVKIPKLKEQKVIAKVLAKVDKEIELLEKELEYLKEQKKGLMQLLLTGKVRVKC